MMMIFDLVWPSFNDHNRMNSKTITTIKHLCDDHRGSRSPFSMPITIITTPARRRHYTRFHLSMMIIIIIIILVFDISGFVDCYETYDATDRIAEESDSMTVTVTAPSLAILEPLSPSQDKIIHPSPLPDREVEEEHSIGQWFDCRNKTEGYFADLIFCDIFHYCKPDGNRYTFICPRHSYYNPELMSCQQHGPSTSMADCRMSSSRHSDEWHLGGNEETTVVVNHLLEKQEAVDDDARTWNKSSNHSDGKIDPSNSTLLIPATVPNDDRGDGEIKMLSTSNASSSFVTIDHHGLVSDQQLRPTPSSTINQTTEGSSTITITGTTTMMNIEFHNQTDNDDKSGGNVSTSTPTTTMSKNDSQTTTLLDLIMMNETDNGSTDVPSSTTPRFSILVSLSRTPTNAHQSNYHHPAATQNPWQRSRSQPSHRPQQQRPKSSSDVKLNSVPVANANEIIPNLDRLFKLFDMSNVDLSTTSPPPTWYYPMSEVVTVGPSQSRPIISATMMDDTPSTSDNGQRFTLSFHKLLRESFMPAQLFFKTVPKFLKKARDYEQQNIPKGLNIEQNEGGSRGDLYYNVGDNPASMMLSASNIAAVVANGHSSKKFDPSALISSQDGYERRKQTPVTPMAGIATTSTATPVTTTLTATMIDQDRVANDIDHNFEVPSDDKISAMMMLSIPVLVPTNLTREHYRQRMSASLLRPIVIPLKEKGKLVPAYVLEFTDSMAAAAAAAAVAAATAAAAGDGHGGHQKEFLYDHHPHHQMVSHDPEDNGMSIRHHRYKRSHPAPPPSPPPPLPPTPILINDQGNLIEARPPTPSPHPSPSAPPPSNNSSSPAKKLLQFPFTKVNLMNLIPALLKNKLKSAKKPKAIGNGIVGGGLPAATNAIPIYIYQKNPSHEAYLASYLHHMMKQHQQQQDNLAANGNGNGNIYDLKDFNQFLPPYYFTMPSSDPTSSANYGSYHNKKLIGPASPASATLPPLPTSIHQKLASKLTAAFQQPSSAAGKFMKSSSSNNSHNHTKPVASVALNDGKSTGNAAEITKTKLFPYAATAPGYAAKPTLGFSLATTNNKQQHQPQSYKQKQPSTSGNEGNSKIPMPANVYVPDELFEDFQVFKPAVEPSAIESAMSASNITKQTQDMKQDESNLISTYHNGIKDALNRYNGRQSRKTTPLPFGNTTPMTGVSVGPSSTSTTTTTTTTTTTSTFAPDAIVINYANGTTLRIAGKKIQTRQDMIHTASVGASMMVGPRLDSIKTGHSKNQYG